MDYEALYKEAARAILDHFDYDQYDEEVIEILRKYFPAAEPSNRLPDYPPDDDENTEWIDDIKLSK